MVRYNNTDTNAPIITNDIYWPAVCRWFSHFTDGTQSTVTYVGFAASSDGSCTAAVTQTCFHVPKKLLRLAGDFKGYNVIAHLAPEFSSYRSD